MTPNDLDAYLKVLTANRAGAAVIELPSGAKFSVTLVPDMPLAVGSEPTPGGWKGMHHLDNPTDLRDDSEYKGDLP